jgi:hypothetical protein
MYAIVRKYTLNEKANDEVTRKIKEGFLPIVRGTPGFVDYYWTFSDGVGMSVGLFDSQEGADASTRAAREYIQQNLQGVLRESQDITKAEVLVHA